MTTQTLYPALRYVDAPGAIAWLERAFGVKPEEVYPNEDGSIAHAQLRAGSDLLMLGSARLGSAQTSPKGHGGRGSGALYLCTPDVEAIYERALGAGAKIVRPIAGVEYDDSKSFTAEDCEGYVWSFGGYAPVPDSGLSPCLRYDDPLKAIAWLRDVCGFGEQLVVPDADGVGVAHSEITLGRSVLMCGSRRDDDLNFDTPLRVGMSLNVYAFTPDPDALFARIENAGAQITRRPEDMEYGSREFGVNDPEGNPFTFGTYRP